MPRGGTIEVCADNVHLTNDEVGYLPEGEYVRFKVKDRGHGISKENLQNIFDPYFTTKTGGSGLGLAISYSIVKNHGGHIDVESEIDKGTTFSIYLPASNSSIDKVLRNNEISTGTSKILVMDDEEVIIKMIGIMLKRIGYEVVGVGNGQAAISKYLEAKELGVPFDAVILDLTIKGGMGGQETIEELVKYDPAIKAIVSSGYSNDPVMSNFKEYGFSGVCEKPYSIAGLSQVISSVLKS